jgi:hypothetical protein
MAVYVLTSTFGKGEASPKLWSRADLQDYKMWLKECRNWITMRTGGLKRRPGTEFIGELKTSSRIGKLLPFIFSVSQTYVLVFNAGVYRVYALGGRVGTVEVAHSYADADLPTVDFDQTNDVLDITHKAYQPRRVKRQSDTSWSIDTVPFRFGPYLPVNDTSTSLTPSATGNPIPKMTSNTAPSGTAAVSGSALGAAWNAFDRDAGTAWHGASSSNEWVSYTFPSAKIIVGYSVTAYAGLVTAVPVTDRAPQSWTFEGSNDGVNWTVLDSQFAQNNWSAGETRYFRFNNTVAYLGYRLFIQTNNGGQYITVGELAFTEDMSTAPPITITASSTVGINNGSGFSADDVGRIVALLGTNAVYRAFVITAFTDSTHVSAKLDDAPLPTAQATLQWRLGAWGTTPGWPAHVATFEGRKIYARTNAQPSGIWGTKTGGYGSFLDFSVANPVKDDDAISFTLSDVNEIGAIAEGPDLQIGTAGAARTMGRDSPNLPFSATNYRQSLASTHGFEAVRPVKVGGSSIFASSFGKALREFTQGDTGGYVVPDISIKSDHLFATKVIEMAYAQEPDSVVWAPNGKGELIGSTFEKEQDMAGFHRHILGPDATVENVCVIPGPDTDRSELWLIVRRDINGVTKRYIERLGPSFDGEIDDPADAWYLDCALQYNGAPTTTVTGLGHLEGKTVSILADGAREKDQVVVSGTVALDSGRPASKILVGLAFQSVAHTLPSTLSVGDGSGLGRKKKVVNAMVDVLHTGSLRVGRDVASAEEIVIRKTSSNLGEAVPLVSGFLTSRAATSWTDKGEVTMVADGPFPATIRSLTLALETEP